MDTSYSFLKTHLPLTSNQNRLWILSQQDNANPAYNLPHTYHIEGDVDYEIFSRSINLLFDRQHTIFSVFRQTDGNPYIDIVRQEVQVEIVDFSYLPPEVRKDRIFEFSSEVTRETFDIEKGPLFRLYLLKEDNNSYYFHSVIHHLIFDGWSMTLFLKDLSTIYSDLCRGAENSLSPLPLHSYDLVQWENERSTGSEDDLLKAFWKEYLKECPSELKFPYDFPRKKALSGLGYRESFVIPEIYTEGLERLANEANSSMFKTMLAVLGVLIAKYTGEEDICLGFPVSSRRGHSSLDDIFGFFVSTSVARLKVDGNISFRQYLGSAREKANMAIKNSKLPFDKIIETVNPERIPFQNPLFQFSLSWLNNVFPFDLNGAPCKRVNVPESIAPFDISFYLWKENNSIKGEIEYSIDLFRHDTILRLKDHLSALIKELTGNPDKPLGSVTLLTDSEKLMMDKINQTKTDYPKEKTIPQLFEEQVTLYSEKAAVIYKNSVLTYNKLNERANQLARTLLNLGVKPNTPVGILADKSLEMIVGVLGILKAGAAYLPVDPDYPSDRINFIIEESDCKVLLTHAKYMNLEINNVSKINIDSNESYEKDGANPENRNSSSDLAYFIYTSGTTGVPKGSMIRHFSVIRTVRNVNYMDMSSEDRLLYTSAVVFDVTTYEIWGALLNGMTLYVVDKETILDTEALGRELLENKITILHLTSALFTQIAEDRIDIFSGLTYLLIGGDVLSPFHVNKVRKANPQLKVINCYGPSENTTYSTTYLIEKDHETNIPIGKPISNSTVYILDKYLNYQPVGIMGELYVGGDGLSKGYIKREDLNRVSFVDHPFIKGERLYKTGDFGKWLSDGNIEFHGRVDNQIKIRGFRVELEEIESVISQIEGVIETVIKPIKTQKGDFRLVAFLNVPDNFQMDGKEIGLRIKGKLPVYMMPSAYKLMHGFPKTINGKTDKRALKVEVSEFEGRPGQDILSLSSTEQKLLSIWSEALQTGQFTINDNFFDIGGNSLLSVRIINKIRDVFKISLTFGDFVMHSTIHMLGEFIDNQAVNSADSISLVHMEGNKNLPLTRNQKRLWLMSQMNPDIASYIIRITYKLCGNLNLAIFEQSLNLLFQRHTVLHSVIKKSKDDPYCNLEPQDIKIRLIDIKAFEEGEKQKRILEILRDDSRKTFDLEKGPLYRISLILSTDDQVYFHMCIHHIIFDGWSEGILINDLSSIYNSLLSGNEIRLEPLEFQQYDYARCEEESVESQESISYWRESLSNCSPIVNFPYDFPRQETSTGKGLVESIRLPKEFTEKLRKLSQEAGTSVFNILMAGFGTVIHKYSGEDDLNIGLPVTYRPHTKLENILGMFVNTLVIRLKYDRGTTFRELITKSEEVTLNAISHQDIPFERVVEIVNPERIINANPLFQIAFVWQNNLSQPFKMNGLRSERIKIHERAPIFDLILYLWENDKYIDGEIEYNTDLLKHETILRFKDHYEAFVSNLVENPDVPISDLSMISETELRMIQETNNTFTEYSKEKRIIDLFEERVAKNPENLAVSIDNLNLTYSELNRRADRLAGVLQANKICRGEFVGILLKRSPDLIVCLLALYKAGAAYVPLNITDPVNRVISILEAARIKSVITNNDNNIELPEKVSKLFIEDLLAEKNGLPSYVKDPDCKSTDSAYIIFTSGTTGTPKGVLVNHKAVINLIEWVNRTFSVSDADKLLWATNLSFDLSVYDIFGILASGGCIRILNDDDRLDPKRQFEIILKEGITFWDSAPQSLQQLTPYFNVSEITEDYKSLRLVFLSGDWIPLSLPSTITSVFSNAVVVGLGGATEATVWSNYFIINEIKQGWKSIPYGKPIQNARYYIFNEHLKHCRIKEPGNLYIGGDCLALGYYNDPKLTTSKFITDPFAQESKLYFTGDKAQWMEDGNIEFLGRDDDQIKIRGYRVELGEIKNAALLNSNVKEALLLSDKSDLHDIKVILFLTIKNHVSFKIKEFRNNLRTILPEYMIPSDIFTYEEFPVTSNGKIDTKLLLQNYKKSVAEDISTSEIKDNQTRIESLTTTQSMIFGLWSEVLHKSSMSVTDNFFDIGGNSLLGIRIINLVRENLGYPLTFRELILNATISQLGDLIDKQKPGPKESINLVHLGNGKYLPLTKNQKRLWLLSKLQPDVATYIIRFSYIFNGNLNYEIFKKSLEILFHKHHIVFSIIRKEDSEPYCDIVPSEVNISFIDYSDLPENDKREKVNYIINEASGKSFDLENGPLYRLYLLKTAEKEHYFQFSIHHIIFDGWSWGVLVKDLSIIYNSLITGREPETEELEFQQYDYAQWESKSEENKDSIVFWQNNLEGCSPVLNFPYDFQRREQPSGKGSFIEIIIPEVLSDKLKKLTREAGSSLYTTIMSGFGVLIHKYIGENDFNLGLPVVYRPHSKLENIFGMFVNTVVIRFLIRQGITFKDMIRQTDEASLNAINHQDIPFETIVNIVNPERSYNMNPLFQIAFVWQNNLKVPIELHGVIADEVKSNERAAIFDITLALWESGNIIKGEIQFNTDILKPDTISRFKDHFLILLNNLADNSDAPISSLTMISDMEVKMINAINQTSTYYPKHKTIAQLFEEKSATFPDNLAIAYKDNYLTYKQLNEKANRLARTLRKLGVKPNSPVGLFSDKSLEMIIAVLGILKAGGYYAPIDPEYPEQRINFIVKDADIKILLTQEKYMSTLIPGVQKINLDSEDSFDSDRTNLPSLNDPTDLAYVLYTSGTTGTPKGTPIPQQGVVRLVCNTNYLNINTEDRVLMASAIVFDASTLEIWITLVNGGSLFIIDKETLLNPRMLGEELEKNKITFAALTSALFTHIAEYHSKIFKNLKYLMVGGDVLSAPHVNKVRNDNPDLIIINGYGPTENTTMSTFYVIDHEVEHNIPIGRPNSNSTVYIFDKDMNYQPVGVPGELFVGGDGLSPGYLNRKELTAKCFIEHPSIPGTKIYRTGDLARWLPDWNVEFIGRADNQLKIRGFRVELEEIESVISELNGVVDTVVKPVKVKEGDYRLVAFLNINEAFTIEKNEILAKIRSRLPVYMLPSAFKLMHGFPKTINGKTDRKALKFDVEDLEKKEITDVNRLLPTERIIFNIWCGLLKTENISVTDNFFDVGGNSLLALSLASLISKELNITMDSIIVFKHPTVKDQSDYITGLKKESFSEDMDCEEKIRLRKNVRFKKHHL